MPVYQVETDDGRTYQLDLEQPVPDGPGGRDMLQEILAEQLAHQHDESFDRRNFPVSTAAGDVGRGLVGGLRDFGQQFLDLPTQIGNTITEFISPDAPGLGRRRVVPEMQAPQLPDPTGQPRSGLERTIRTVTPLGLDVATLLLPIGKSIFARRAARRAAERTPMLFEPGSVAEDLAVPRGRRLDLFLEPESPASRPLSRFDKPVPTRGQPAGILKTVPSEGARRLAPVFDFQADRIPQMTQKQAVEAYRRIISRVPDYPIHEVENTPIFELLQRLEQHILSFR